MKEISNCLEQEFELKVVENRDGYLYAKNDVIMALIVSPHEGNDFSYLVRFSTVPAFDRWANSCPIEEFFETTQEVVSFLKNNKTRIYKELLEYLAEEFKYLCD